MQLFELDRSWLPLGRMEAVYWSQLAPRVDFVPVPSFLAPDETSVPIPKKLVPENVTEQDRVLHAMEN